MFPIIVYTADIQATDSHLKGRGRKYVAVCRICNSKPFRVPVPVEKVQQITACESFRPSICTYLVCM